MVLSSSALTIHAEPVARALGITNVLCNTFELDETGLLTGRVNRPIIWGHQKAAAAQNGSANATGWSWGAAISTPTATRTPR